jgi:SAM-dependent methyltransferase
MSAADKVIAQCRKPSGLLGRFILWDMNRHHSKLTDWGLSHVEIKKTDTILDVGCGGGRTISKLADMASNGKVHGVDYSEESVTAAHRNNVRWIDIGRVSIRDGSVSQLSFENNTFDLVTAIETHLFWPDLPNDFREIFRAKSGREVVDRCRDLQWRETHRRRSKKDFRQTPSREHESPHTGRASRSV